VSRSDLACATCPHLTHVSAKGAKLRCPAQGCFCGRKIGRPCGRVERVPYNAHRQAAPGSTLSRLTLEQAHAIQDELTELIWI